MSRTLKSRIMSHLDIQALHIHHGVIDVIALSCDIDVTASSSGNTDAMKVSVVTEIV